VHTEIQVAQSASRLLERLSHTLSSQNREVLQSWPFARYVACLDAYPEMVMLGYRSREVLRACRDIAAMVGDSGLEIYHRALLLALIIRAQHELPRRNLPEDIMLLFGENFDRIIHDIESTADQPGLYRYPLSPFCKDLAHSNRRCEGSRLSFAKKGVLLRRPTEWPLGAPVSFT